ncbi:MAG: site-specific DNA-methyltransferase [Nitrososphaerota archaeon]|nr:site-specific DNA-methyltransferase [Nitrososphaerota archaeon]
MSQGYEGKIDMVYIDPPFLTSEDYHFRLKLAGYGDVVKVPSLLERLAYRDTWDGGIDSYLDMLLPRLQLIRRLLSDRGSLYLHIGSNISHYVRCVLDEVFGKERFVNEIIWRRTAAHNDPGRLGRIHDAILFYSKGPNFIWNPPLVDRTEESIEATFKYAEGPPPERQVITLKKGESPPKGFRRFQTVTLRSPHPRPNLTYDFKGYKPHPNGWSVSREIMERYDREGLLAYPSSRDGAIRLKMYLDESPKIPLQDLWVDIKKLEASSEERIGFDTQKPESLIERIVSESSQPGSLVADFFSGSGTTPAVADRLGRRWVAADFSKVAIQVTRARLVDQQSSPFVIENIGNYQRELIYREGGNIALMQRIVMKLYGAEPHPAHTDLGVLHQGGKRTLVYVGYPDRPLTAKKTAELVKTARSLDGEGYDKLVLLAWDYEYNYDEGIEGRRKGFGVQIEPRLIPPSIYEYLRKSKNEDDLIEKFAKKIQFGAKPYLKIAAPKVTDRGGGEHNVVVTIERYVLSEVPVEDEEDRVELQKLSAGDGFAALIDYWAVDWDYDGKTFRSRWQDFRSDEKEGRPIITRANTTLAESRRFDIAVRVVDVFGNDATATTSVDLR